MRKGIYTYRNDITIEQQHRFIKQAGFDSVMIWWGDQKDEYIKSCAKYDLEICCAHLPFEDVRKLWLPGINDGEEYSQYLCEQISEIGIKGIPVAVMHLTKGSDTYPYNIKGIDRLKRVVDVAEKSDVKIAFENLRLTRYLDYVFDHIHSNNIGFCYDSGHQHYFSPERDVLSDFKHKLLALHIADNDGNADTHSLPYDGTVNWNAFAKILAEIQYSGVLSLEVQQDRDPIYAELSAKEFFELAFERVRRFESEIKNFRNESTIAI